MGARFRRPHMRALFNVICDFVLIYLLYNGGDVMRNPSLAENVVDESMQSATRLIHAHELDRRRISEIGADSSGIVTNLTHEDTALCTGLMRHSGFSSSCEFLRAHPQCMSGGEFFDYIAFFYCGCEKAPAVGYVVLTIWLVALFYLLGNTAADYFCCCLEKLSELLKLPPTVAGVTLLPLGNGAPDVFASIAAFVGKDAGEVGLNSVLGGAVFVTCVVVGTVSLLVADKKVQIDKRCFIRDVGFFFVSLLALTLILVFGRITVWGAVAFAMIYVFYALAVAANEFLRKHARRMRIDAVTPLLPVRGSVFSHGIEDNESIYSPLLDTEAPNDGPHLTALPQWMWASNVAIYSNHGLKVSGAENPPALWGWNIHDEEFEDTTCTCLKVLTYMELPLTIPRRLTIPIVEEERWSKGYGVASATLAPLLFAFLWNRWNAGSIFGITVYIAGFLIGAVLGSLAYFFTRPDQPPRRFLFPWVFGGFLMSIVWFYIIANELVALLVAFGVILGINPSILGLTVLAWGNSMGDLVSNIALAMSGDDGLQIAMSGSYAGPMFNTLVGLGVSLLIGAWSRRPTSFDIPQDNSLFWTIGFLLSGLAWALVVLPRNDMRPSKLLGVGLIALYLVFLTTRICSASGLLSIGGLS